MVTGRVSEDGREAVIELRLSSPGALERSTTVPAVVDTGFTDWLTIPTDTAENLGLSIRGAVDVELADGGIQRLAIYRVRVYWHRQRRLVRAYATPGGEALIGMALLRGSRLSIDAMPGGPVLVTELS